MTAKEVTWFLGKGEAYGVGDVLRVLHATGARPGELCSALVSDFVSSAKQLRLLHWKNGRKTGMSRRIPLSEEATAIVVRLCRRRKGDEPIFTGPDGAAWTPNRLQKIFRKIREGKWRGLTDGGQFEQLTQKQALLRIKKTAQRESLTLYDFRHLWISDALQQGVPVATIATMAGTSIKMVEKTYGHFRSDDLGAVASMIEKRRQRSV
jgi:integrase